MCLASLVVVISSHLECYSAFVCFLDCEVFHFFCRLSFNLGFFSISPWLSSGREFLADATEVMVESSLPPTRRLFISLDPQPQDYGRHSSPPGHTQKLSHHFMVQDHLFHSLLCPGTLAPQCRLPVPVTFPRIWKYHGSSPSSSLPTKVDWEHLMEILINLRGQITPWAVGAFFTTRIES